MFSTCTINKNENEAGRDFVLRTFPELKLIKEKVFLQGIDDCDGFNYIYQNLFRASGATDNSHTNGAAGGRGDGGRDDLDIWDDTVSDNVWKENVIRADRDPDGYRELRESITRTAGGWLSKLPGAAQ